MSRYIDADKLKQHYAYWESSKYDYMQEEKKLFDDIVDQQPTVDAVEVVRCKDCKYRKKNTFCLHNMRYEDDNGFCSYGERGKYEKNN